MFLNRAFDEVFGSKVCYMHHEQACAMAAEGYARIAGKPALVNVTTGPGSINAMNGVFGAYTDSIPMIVISGQVKRETMVSTYPDPNLRQLGDQEAKIIDMVRPICKLAESVGSEEELEHVIPRAIQCATQGRPGLVWVDIPADIQMSTKILNFISSPVQRDTQHSNMSDVRQTVTKLLASSKRPLILAGTGIRLSGTVNELERFSKTTGIPVATAWTHDLIDSSSEYFCWKTGNNWNQAGKFLPPERRLGARFRLKTQHQAN